MEKFNILISGATGVTSRSVVRSLSISPYFKGRCRFIGTDVCYNEYGIYEGLYDKVYKVPYTTSSDYRSIMERIIKENGIEYAFLIPELEALYWYEHPFNVKYLRIPPAFARTVISKKALYDALSETSIVPKYQILKREELLNDDNGIVSLSYPMWIRDYSEGTTSGKGSFCAFSIAELRAWALINKGIDHFMLSEYLPGRNLGCFTLFNNGRLLKYGVAERIDYLMGKVSVSGITGNTCRGKLVNDRDALDVALEAINMVLSKTGEIMNGLVVTDLKCDDNNVPKVTEINIRHVAFTSTFANAGLNFCESQLLCMMDRENEVSRNLTIRFPENNLMLRDVDGWPIYLSDYHKLNIGQFYARNID